MKRFIGLFAVVILMVLCAATPALAAGLRISPPTVEFDVPADSSAEVEFVVYDFNGDLEISLEDIPLTVEPTTVPVTAKAEGTTVVLTLYGDESLGSKIYEGKIRFLAMTGGTVAMGIKVRATVTNLVEGETPVLVSPKKPVPVEQASPEAPAPTEQAPPSPAPPLPPSPAPPLPPSPTQPTTGLPILLLAGIGAGTLIVITLIVVFARRRRY